MSHSPASLGARKQAFIEAVKAGAALTKTGVVAPRTYQKWMKEDPEFAAAVKAAKRDPKAEFIEAVRNGASVTNSGIVTDVTYYNWRKADPAFCAAVDAAIAERDAKRKTAVIALLRGGTCVRSINVATPFEVGEWIKADPEFARSFRAYKPPRRKRTYTYVKVGDRVKTDRVERLRAEPVYAKARRLLGDKYRTMPDAREDILNELVLMILSGEEPVVSKAATRVFGNSRDELPTSDAWLSNAEFESVWEYA